MTKYISLLRGINVGGRNKLTMKELKELLKDLCLSNIKTYIQSGNIVFTSSENIPKLSAKISQAIYKRYNFKPQVIIITEHDLDVAMLNNPFKDSNIEAKYIQFCFLNEEAKAVDYNKMNSLKTASEDFQLFEKVLYLQAPDGIGRSKLAANIEKCIGVAMTVRNLKTVTKIKELIESI